MRTAALVLMAGFWSAAAVAAPAPTPSVPSQPPKDLSGLTVYPNSDPPKVTATYPAAGQALQAGVLILTVTFDQKMRQAGFDFSPAPGGEMPKCLKTPRLLADGKTFALLCTTDPHKTYALALNGGAQGGFVSVAERRAAPAALTFSTTDADGPRSVPDALKAENLPTIDLPIEVDPHEQAKPTP